MNDFSHLKSRLHFNFSLKISSWKNKITRYSFSIDTVKSLCTQITVALRLQPYLTRCSAKHNGYAILFPFLAPSVPRSQSKGGLKLPAHINHKSICAHSQTRPRVMELRNFASLHYYMPANQVHLRRVITRERR